MGKFLMTVRRGLLVVFLTLVASVMYSQTITVKGTVYDDTNYSLVGATVMVVGSGKGVATDIDGKYQIEVEKGKKLRFQYVGMITQEIVVDKPEINVVLKSDTKTLEDVTVVAFAKQKKESVIASVTTVKPAELKVPSSNLTTALAGKLSGVISYQTSGEPGQDDATFFVRGVTSFTYARGPLILIDGVEMTTTDLSRLQPDDIASFSIMKDAAATALYGARGGNGVILVTTKDGKEGKPVLSVRVETSLSEPTSMIELADPITYMQLNNEATLTRNPLAESPYSLEKIERTAEPGANRMIFPANDWYSMLMKNNTINQRYNFSLSGGTKAVKYYIAGTYNQDNGVLKVDKRNSFNSNIDLKRYQLRSNITLNVTPSTQLVVRFTGNYDDYTGPIDGGSELYKKVLRSDPTLFPAYYEKADMDYVHHIMFGNYGAGNYINPYADMVRGYKQYQRTNVLGQFEVHQDFDQWVKGLRARALFTTQRASYYDITRAYTPYYYTLDSYDAIKDTYTLTNITQGTEYLTYNPDQGSKEVTSVLYGEAAVNYDRTFGDHAISGMLVGTIRESKTANASTLALSLPRRNLGLAGRFTYNYDSRYFLELNFGYNGSERFAKNERFGFFPSAGIGYIVSNESFWPKNWWGKTFINMLKLKYTYGIVGNDDIGTESERFFYLSNVNMSGSGYTWGQNWGNSYSGVSITQYPNEFITWERSYKQNYGVEMRLFNAIDLQIDYYRERRTGILMSRAYIPSTMGTTAAIKANLGEASSEGVDMSMDVNYSFNKDLWIQGRANFTYATAKYDKYEDVDRTETPWLSKVGQSTSQTWGYVAERLFVDDEEAINSPIQFGTPGVNYGAGDIKYRDINNDGKITTDDKVPIGFSTTPEIIYGFGVSVGYKGFDASCFFQGSARSSFFIDPTATAPFVDTDGNDSQISKNALLKAYADSHWSENNRDLHALWPRLSDTVNENNTQTSTWWLRDGSFLRFKTLEIGYTLPEKIIKNVWLSNARIYLSGNNLLCWSKFKLWDPEMKGNGLAYPIQRVYNIGVQLSF